MEEQSASNEELLRFPAEILKEKGYRPRQYKFCESPFKRFISSGLLLKGFALAFGLWNPRRKWRCLFALIFLLVDVYLLLLAVISMFDCPPGITLVGWFCVNTTLELHSGLNITSTCAEHKGIFFLFCTRKRAIVGIFVNVSGLVSHLTFFWSAWMLSKENSSISQENIPHLVSPSRWTKLNCVILLFFVALISCQAIIAVHDSSPINLAFANMSYGVSWWTSLLTCWLFGSMMSSLETIANRCKHDIMTSEHLDDAITQHQQLCKTIFATSHVFKPWFIVHWIVYTITCVYWVANLVFFLSLVQSWKSCFKLTIKVVIYFYVFVYPCYKAAALTGKCKQMLADFNLTTEKDWHDNHPFRKRSELHLFLHYASYVDCGYKVGQFTFGSMSVFFSTLLAVVGFGLKIL